MSVRDAELRRVNRQGGLALPERAREIIGDSQEVGVSWGGGVIVLSPSSDFGDASRSYHQGKVILPSDVRKRWGEGRYYRVEVDEDDGRVELYPQVTQDASEVMVDDAF